MSTTEKAIFAAGCFWGVEATFQEIGGVVGTRVGYIGGNTPQPDYKSVCTGNTGHAEAVEVIFDNDKISYRELLGFFWQAHDPTQKNRQGPDVGSQYRSAIFYMNTAQRDIAEASKAAEQKHRGNDIVTEITLAGDFWQAEDYHQNYVRKKRGTGFFGLF